MTEKELRELFPEEQELEPMTKEQLMDLKKKINELSDEDKKQRDLYLRGLAIGDIQGPPVGFASIDKPWLKYYSEETILTDLPKQTMYNYIKSRNSSGLDRAAIEYFGNCLTYNQLMLKIDECANSLVALGVGAGDIVTICMPTTPEMVYMFYALSKIGAVSNMIDPRKSPKEIEEYANEVNSKVFLGIDVAEEKYIDLRENTSVEHVIIATPYETFKNPIKYILKLKDKINKKKKVSNCLTWDDFIKLGKNTMASEKEYEKDKVVTIVHTGGTTGKAKGVMLSNDNINAGALQCEISGLDFGDRGTWLDIMPPFIVYGVGNGLHLPLSMGMKVILMPSFDPTKYDDILLKHRPNYMAGVPSHYGYLLKSEKLKNVDLSFIKTPIVGGDKMDYTLEEQVNEFLKEHNCKTKIIKGYGMSEVDAAVSVCINGEINKLKSVGIPLSHTVIGIYEPETGIELPYNQHGELRITGPNVMLGYYNNLEEERKILHLDEFGNKWIYSGDSGYYDEDSYLYVDGRYKELIIRPDGFKVYPSAIEEVILLHDAVSECKVVGCRDYFESQGELPKAYIILKSENFNYEQVMEEIKQLCQIHLAEYSLPFDYEFIDKFPTTSVGKINTSVLKEMAEEKIKIKRKIK